MSDLVAFLNARLDEDEAAAKAAAADVSYCRDWETDFEVAQDWTVFAPAQLTLMHPVADTWWQGTATHIARHDPARVLREVEADRKLLDLYERASRYRDQVFARPEPRNVSDEMRAVTQMLALEQVMKFRAAVWSDHPDYDPAWA